MIVLYAAISYLFVIHTRFSVSNMLLYVPDAGRWA